METRSDPPVSINPFVVPAGAWLEEELARRLSIDATPQANLPSYLRVVLVCALLGAMLWALAGYGAYHLIAG